MKRFVSHKMKLLNLALKESLSWKLIKPLVWLKIGSQESLVFLPKVPNKDFLHSFLRFMISIDSQQRIN